MLYIALIGDIIHSKKIEDRTKAQQSLLELLEELNQTYKFCLVSPFTITTGDEFQALFTPNKYIFEIIEQFTVHFSYPIRFGVGLGEIVTKINRKQSIGSDGPAYWRAREAIDFIHDKNDYGVSKIAVSLKNKEASREVNAILSACSFIESKWTNSQREILVHLLKYGIYDENFYQKDIGDSLGLDSSAISRRIKSAGTKIYLRNKRLAMDIILKEAEEKEKNND